MKVDIRFVSAMRGQTVTWVDENLTPHSIHGVDISSIVCHREPATGYYYHEYYERYYKVEKEIAPNVWRIRDGGLV